MARVARPLAPWLVGATALPGTLGPPPGHGPYLVLAKGSLAGAYPPCMAPVWVLAVGCRLGLGCCSNRTLCG